MVIIAPLSLSLAVLRPIPIAIFFTAVAIVAHALGFTADLAKQLRWARRMSARGPIVWSFNWAVRTEMRARRWLMGTKLDVEPLVPTVVGTSTRGTRAVVLKWKVRPTSRYSRETYEVALALADGSTPVEAAAAEALEWRTCVQPGQTAEPQCTVGELEPDTDYAVRVRAVNARGTSGWCAGAFRTRQEPVDGGGRGPGYRWTQTGSELRLSFPVGADLRAKMLRVSTKVCDGLLLVAHPRLASPHLAPRPQRASISIEALEPAAGAGHAGRALLQARHSSAWHAQMRASCAAQHVLTRRRVRGGRATSSASCRPTRRSGS